MAYERKDKNTKFEGKKTTGGRGFGDKRTDNKTEKKAFEWGKKPGSDRPTGDKPYGKPNTGKFSDRRPADGKKFAEDKEFHKTTERQNNRRMTHFEEESEEDQDNINLIEGRNPVLEALKSGREIEKIFVQKGAGEGSIRQIIAIAREKGILIKEVDKAKLDGLSQTKNHQGVIASAALYKYYEVDEILAIAKEKGEDPFIIILDEITDNNNLGAILRTADAAGVHGVIIPKRRSVGLTPVVAKTSAGAIEYVPVAKVTNISQTMEFLKKEGLWIIGADMSGETYYKKDLTGAVALVIGSEGEGMGRLVKEHCDFLVSIPMKGKISSLNASVSTAILTYEIDKQRRLKSVEGSIH